MKCLQVISTMACIILAAESFAMATHFKLEKEYQQAWCDDAGGQSEYVLDNKIRVDCITNEYAIEFDFAPKWAEAVGQSLYYAIIANKKPGIVLILERESDERHFQKLETVAAKHGVTVWTIRYQKGFHAY